MALFSLSHDTISQLSHGSLTDLSQLRLSLISLTVVLKQTKIRANCLNTQGLYFLILRAYFVKLSVPKIILFRFESFQKPFLYLFLPIQLCLLRQAHVQSPKS